MNPRRILRWLGRTLPREWIVVAVLGYVVVEVLRYWLVPPAGREHESFLKIRDGFMIIAAAGYGFFRVSAFHPVFQSEYRAWLARTPWRRGKPLPIGPVHLVVQDALVVGLLCVAQHDAVLHRALLPAWFFVGYHGGLAVGCTLAGAKWWAYVLGYMAALVVRLLVFPIYALAAGMLLYIVSLAALRATLNRFPWEAANEIQELRKRFSARKEDVRDRRSTTWTTELFVRDRLDERLGWPFGVIDTHDLGIQVSRLDGFLTSLLVGWWAHAVLAITPANVGDTLSWMVLAYVLIAGVCGRLSVYCSHYRPPINLWGRIATGRVIIAGYDRVWIGPLAALIAGAAIPVGGAYANLPPSLYMPAAFLVTLSLLAGAEPSLREWRATGNHRIVPGTLNKHKFLEH